MTTSLSDTRINTRKMNSLLDQIRKQSNPGADTQRAITQFLHVHAFHAFRYASTHLRNLPSGLSGREEFESRALGAWTEMFANLSRWENIQERLALVKHERVLIAGWHFPEMPRIFSFAKKANVLMLTASEAPWLVKLKAAGCAVDFKSEAGRRKVEAEFAKGRVMGALLDSVDADTETVPAPLFGRPSKTPSAIFELCAAHRYTIAFISPRKGRVRVVATVKAAGRSAAELAAKFNQWMEEEVEHAPERWLLWTSLPYRLEPQRESQPGKSSFRPKPGSTSDDSLLATGASHC